jgi:hypothetical protein
MINEKRLRMLVTRTSISKWVQHSLVLPEYYSDIVAIGQQDGILGTYYLICSRPNWHGVPGIPTVQGID